MRIALVDTNKKPKFYPLGLMKISAWLKDNGHECVFFNNTLPPAGEFDEIWISCIFTFDVGYSLGMIEAAKQRANKVYVGGVSPTLLPKHFEATGVHVVQGKISEAEKYSPDYDILGEKPAYSILKTSDGCIRKCKFCMVPILEPEYKERDWAADIYPGTKKFVFFDNNWLAKDRKSLISDVEKLRGMYEAGKVTEIDFNQGLDARLVTEEIGALLEGLPIKPVRFAFDGMHEDGHYQRAIEIMHKHGFKSFMSYVLYNFTDTPKDFYYRLKEGARLSEKLGVSVGSFPMRFQPILEIDSQREHVGKYWTKQKRDNFMNILNKQSVAGQVSFSKVSDFEYWFGESSEKFDKLLSYPKLNEYMARKKGALRYERAKNRNVSNNKTPKSV